MKPITNHGGKPRGVVHFYSWIDPANVGPWNIDFSDTPLLWIYEVALDWLL